MIIVIDGPAGSGKSSTARAVAGKMNIAYLDSGALYRALTWLYIQANQDKGLFFDRLKQCSISFSYTDAVFHVVVDGEDITNYLRSNDVVELVSSVASFSRTRAAVNSLMKKAVANGQYIAEGRDLGTVVFPDAALKFYMVADVQERARRRFKDLKTAGDDVTFEQVLHNIKERDRNDANRKIAPLKEAPDALKVDTTDLDFDEQVQRICTMIDERVKLVFKQ